MSRPQKYKITLGQQPTMARAYEAIDRAEQKNMGVMVPARWLRKILQDRVLMARLACDSAHAQFCNPKEVWQAQSIRDSILAEGVA